jgi:uroporphyrinogen-III synthase
MTVTTQDEGMDAEAPFAALTGLRIAVPESRQLDVLSDMLQVRGAVVRRCPLVAICDSPDQAGLYQQLEMFCQQGADDFIFLTGEGLRRLTQLAQRHELLPQWIASLSRLRKIVRGPKPANALRELGLKPDVIAQSPTTSGVMASLDEDLQGRRIYVQLYGEEPNWPLRDFLNAKGAEVTTIAPYIYANDVDTEQVADLIRAVMAGELDAIVFTSLVQVKRLVSVAEILSLWSGLQAALAHCIVAAVGPVVAECLAEKGVAVTVMPEDKFFMKPLVRRLADYWIQTKSG